MVDVSHIQGGRVKFAMDPATGAAYLEQAAIIDDLHENNSDLIIYLGKKNGNRYYTRTERGVTKIYSNQQGSPDLTEVKDKDITGVLADIYGSNKPALDNALKQIKNRNNLQSKIIDFPAFIQESRELTLIIDSTTIEGRAQRAFDELVNAYKAEADISDNDDKAQKEAAAKVSSQKENLEKLLKAHPYLSLKGVFSPKKAEQAAQAQVGADSAKEAWDWISNAVSGTLEKAGFNFPDIIASYTKPADAPADPAPTPESKSVSPESPSPAPSDPSTETKLEPIPFDPKATGITKTDLTKIALLFETGKISEISVGDYVIKPAMEGGKKFLKVYDDKGKTVNITVPMALRDGIGKDGFRSNPKRFSRILDKLVGLSSQNNLKDKSIFLSYIFYKSSDSAKEVTAGIVNITSKLILVTNVKIEENAKMTADQAEQLRVALSLEGNIDDLPEDIRNTATTTLTSAKEKLDKYDQKQAAEAQAKDEAKAFAEKEEIDSVSADIGKAKELYTLTLIYKQKGPLIDSNPELKTALYAAARKLIIDTPLSPKSYGINQTLLDSLTLEKGECFVRFEDSNNLDSKGKPKVYIVLAKKAAEGWSFVTKVDPAMEYYIEDNDGQPLVRSEIGSPDPKFNTLVMHRQPTVPVKPGAKAPAKKGATQPAAGEGSEAFLSELGVTDTDKDGDIDLEDIDANKDGKISGKEAAAIGIKEGSQLFTAIDNQMKANGTNGDGYLTLVELKEFYRVASKFAKITGRDLAATLILYQQCTLSNVNLEKLETARGDIEKAVSAQLGEEILKKEAIADLLIKCGFSSDLVDSVLAQIEGDVTPEKIAAIIMNLVLGSRSKTETQTGLWGIKKPLTTPFPADAPLDSESILEFLKSGKVTAKEEPEEAEEAKGAKGKKGKKESDSLSQAEIEAITEAEKKAQAKDQPKILIAALEPISKKHPNNYQLLKILAQAYSKAGQHNLAIKTAFAVYENNSGSENKQSLMEYLENYIRATADKRSLSTLERAEAMEIDAILTKLIDGGKLNEKELEGIKQISTILKAKSEEPPQGQEAFEAALASGDLSALEKAVPIYIDGIKAKIAELNAIATQTPEDKKKLYSYHVTLYQLHRNQGLYKEAKAEAEKCKPLQEGMQLKPENTIDWDNAIGNCDELSKLDKEASSGQFADIILGSYIGFSTQAKAKGSEEQKQMALFTALEFKRRAKEAKDKGKEKEFFEGAKAAVIAPKDGYDITLRDKGFYGDKVKVTVKVKGKPTTQMKERPDKIRMPRLKEYVGSLEKLTTYFDDAMKDFKPKP